MSKLIDCFNYDLDEMLEFISTRGKFQIGGCQGCVADHRARLRGAWVAYAGLRPLMDPKGPTSDFEELYYRSRRLTAQLVRLLRWRAVEPDRCEKHADPHPSVCSKCWPSREVDLEAANSVADDWSDLLRARLLKSCRHVTVASEHREVPVIGFSRVRKDGERNGTRYELECPFCERELNEGVEALRAEREKHIPFADYAAYDRWARESISDHLQLIREDCVHLVELDPGRVEWLALDGEPGDRELYLLPTKRTLPRVDAQERPPLPTSIPDVGDARRLLSSLDRAALVRAFTAIELHVEQLEASDMDAQDYSLVGLTYSSSLDESTVARTAFLGHSEEAAEGAEPLSQAEIVMTQTQEEAARATGRMLFGDDFSGFNHLEGGTGDVLMDADVAASRFRYDELVAPWAQTTEARFDISGPSEIIDREARAMPRDLHLQERDAYRLVQLKLRDRLDLLDEWDEEFVPSLPSMSDEALELLGRYRSLLSRQELADCDPLFDQPMRAEALYRPDQLRWRIVMREHNAQAARPVSPVEHSRFTLEPAGDDGFVYDADLAAAYAEAA